MLNVLREHTSLLPSSKGGLADASQKNRLDQDP